MSKNIGKGKTKTFREYEKLISGKFFIFIDKYTVSEKAVQKF